jgi:hypothetical protein
MAASSAGDGLDLTQNLLGVSDISEVLFAVGCGQVQLVSHTNQLAALQQSVCF